MIVPESRCVERKVKMAMSELKKILVVDDEPDIQTVAGLALEDVAGFQVAICSSGLEALEVAPVFLPDLILLDVMMPKMDGLQTLKALRNVPELAAIPVIFLTAKVQHEEVSSYKEHGAIDVIAKPFDPMELGNSVRRIWEAFHAASRAN